MHYSNLYSTQLFRVSSEDAKFPAKLGSRIKRVPQFHCSLSHSGKLVGASEDHHYRKNHEFPPVYKAQGLATWIQCQDKKTRTFQTAPDYHKRGTL